MSNRNTSLEALVPVTVTHLGKVECFGQDITPCLTQREITALLAFIGEGCFERRGNSIFIEEFLVELELRAQVDHHPGNRHGPPDSWEQPYTDFDVEFCGLSVCKTNPMYTKGATEVNLYEHFTSDLTEIVEDAIFNDR